MYRRARTHSRARATARSIPQPSWEIRTCQGSAPTTLVTTVRPIAGDGRRYAVRFNGSPLCRSTTQPLLDGARELLKLGYPADSVIETWREGASECAMRAPIGAAAKVSVKGASFV